MYGELADWFHLVTSPHEYAVEAEFYGRVLRESSQIPVKSVLELGSGGGNNASHLKGTFDLTLTDVSEAMLALSERINPSCEHVQGDMRTLRLDREFDAVFAHDALSYMTTRDDLRAAVETASEHCRPGGVALFAPDHTRETFWATTDHGGHDGDGRGLRYLEWTWDPDPADETYTVDYALMSKEADGSVRVVHDRHICGLFPRDVWLATIERAGFHATTRAGIEQETAAEVFVGVKPA